MFKLLKIVRDVGDVTTDYPFKPLEIDVDFRGKPNYVAEQCITCASCTIACPANALTMETDLKTGKRIWQLFLGRCIYCARCEEVCPTHAIVLSNEFETAVMNREDLYTRGVFPLHACPQCGEMFTSNKSLEYALALLEQSGLTKEVVESYRAKLELCPECKQQATLVGSKVFMTKNFSEGDVHE